jgi:FKBP-type peptidyl-prolyl cis-trans isomerase FklB
MKATHIILLLLVFALFGCNEFEKEAELTNYDDSLSYTIGRDLGKSLVRNEIDSVINPVLLAKGIRDYFENDSIFMTQQIVDSFLNEFSMKKRKEAEERKRAETMEKFKDNFMEGEQFLKENAEKEGVIQTETGLQYKVIKEGTGKQPAGTDKVRVHYEGRLIDGTIFDSSYERKEPAEFVVLRVIKGWTEGLQLMKEGGEYELYIPSQLGYGERGSGQIKPYSALIFKVELLKVLETEQSENN